MQTCLHRFFLCRRVAFCHQQKFPHRRMTNWQQSLDNPKVASQVPQTFGMCAWQWVSEWMCEWVSVCVCVRKIHDHTHRYTHTHTHTHAQAHTMQRRAQRRQQLDFQLGAVCVRVQRESEEGGCRVKGKPRFCNSTSCRSLVEYLTYSCWTALT